MEKEKKRAGDGLSDSKSGGVIASEEKSNYKIEHIPSGYEDAEMSVKCEFLPQPNFSWLIVGSRKSGKSNFIRNVLMKKCYLSGMFIPAHIFIFCPTVNLNRDYEALKIPADNIFEGFDKGIIQEILTEQERLITTYGRNRTPNILLLFDDCAYGSALHYNSILNKLAMNGRHYRISYIVAVQTLKSVSPKTRKNLDAITFFPSNILEIDQVVEEYVPKKNRKQVAEILSNYSKIPYSFLQVNRHGEKKYSINFQPLNI
jgi:hypothetical protein